MRIIAGDNKGRRLLAPKGENTRPTTDKVKEAVFSTLGAKVEDAAVLDAFSGTGSLALEALSRGASRAVVMEKDSAALAVIQKNIALCRAADACRVIQGDCLKRIPRLQDRFDLIFLDPPYNRGLLNTALQRMIDGGLADEHTTIVVETDGKQPETIDIPQLVEIKRNLYGDTLIIYFTVTERSKK